MQSKEKNQKRKQKKSRTVKIEGIIEIPNSFDKGHVITGIPVMAMLGHGDANQGKIAFAVAEALSNTQLAINYSVPKKIFDKLDMNKLSFGMAGVVSEREDNIIKKFELSGVSLIKK